MTFRSPRPGTPRRGVGDEGCYERRSTWSFQSFFVSYLYDGESQVNRAPHPQPLSPEYQGEGSRLLHLLRVV